MLSGFVALWSKLTFQTCLFRNSHQTTRFFLNSVKSSHRNIEEATRSSTVAILVRYDLLQFSVSKVYMSFTDHITISPPVFGERARRDGRGGSMENYPGRTRVRNQSCNVSDGLAVKHIRPRPSDRRYRKAGRPAGGS